MAEDRALCQYFDSELDIKQENFTAHPIQCFSRN